MNMRINDGDAESPDRASLPAITCNYLLVVNIPLYRDGATTLAGHLWFKDLVSHIAYLDRLTVACPVRESSPSEVAIPLSAYDGFASVKIAELPDARGLFQALLALPRTVVKLWGLIRNSDIVHAGIAGWPVPYGWIVTPIAKMLGKKLVIIVESAPWRLNAGRPRTIKSLLTASVYERLARWCVGRADLAIFTQENYRQSLLQGRRTGHIIQASWIDEGIIISDEEAHAIWRRKLSINPPELAILFAGRLDRQKGLAVLLDAIRLVERKKLAIKLDILGSGELESVCTEVSKSLAGPTRVGVLGTVSYGPPLYQLLREYHAVIVPNISDEQPRIVYDAYSQGVPVLATRTSGLQACIQENRTGWLVAPDNAAQLSSMLERAAASLGEMEVMGMQALQVARSMTHQQMHHVRHRLLLDLLDAHQHGVHA